MDGRKIGFLQKYAFGKHFYLTAWVGKFQNVVDELSIVLYIIYCIIYYLLYYILSIVLKAPMLTLVFNCL